MPTKLSRLCDAVIEAGWLAALIVTPLFFNVYSNRVFEPDKLSLLRSIALVMLGAWAIKVIDGGLKTGPGHDSPPLLADRSERTTWRAVLRIPLVLPTLLLVAAYLISTILSVLPRVSLWGSYQRLQGTYTTLSYILIAALVLGHLRRREQLDRIIFAVILTSLPISLYGILQHYRLDPLPWGGDVSERVAGNMGNAIFIAAYLIMAFFITLERLVRSFGRLMTEDENTGPDAILAGCYLFIIGVQLIAIYFTQSRGPWLGLLGGLYIFVLLGLVSLRRRATGSLTLTDLGKAVGAGFLWVTLGLVGAAIDGATGFLVGGALGIALTAALYIALVVTRRGLHWLWLSWIVVTLLGIGFLVVFNLPHTPLAPLRELPYIGRLGSVLVTDEGTGKVRVLIWEGASKLILPHAPLIYPDGRTDAVNPIRPLVGYGPESMWVAFNPFYPPDLAHLEARNASPDRSHNETFDSLVITGLFGFLAYIFLFGSIFYYSLRWLGLITSHNERSLFLALFVGGGIVGAIGPLLLEGTLRFLGVGIPAGFIAGFILYVTIAAIRARGDGAAELSPQRLLFIVALLATIVAHFIEIHFGIAIAATRTYFWTLTAVLVLIGTGWLALSEVETVARPQVQAAQVTAEMSRSARRRAKAKQRAQVAAPTQARGFLGSTVSPIWPYAFIGALILLTLAWDYITNQSRDNRTLNIFWEALTTRIPQGQQVAHTSLGILWLVVFTWLVGGMLAVALLAREKNTVKWPRQFGLYSLATWGVFIAFGIWQAASLRVTPVTNIVQAEQLADNTANHIWRYYTGLFIVLMAVAWALWLVRPRPQPIFSRQGGVALVGAGVIAIVLFLFISAVNVDIVRADIYYKQGLAYESEGQWDGSIFLYSKALSVESSEDFYYLFLGRALLERARRTADGPAQLAQGISLQDARSLRPDRFARFSRTDFINVAKVVLEEARRLNPLNTDHSANLGRLYRAWGEMTTDPALRSQRFAQASEYYRQATTLSPNAAHLQNEWAIVFMEENDLTQAEAKLQRSLELDQEFDQTYLLLGDLARAKNDWANAEVQYKKALALNPRLLQARSALAFVYTQQGKLAEAIAENLEVLRGAPNDLQTHRNLALLYQQVGQFSEALAQARIARDLTPENERGPLDQLIAELEKQLGGG
jgi:tetratricopeptide (TPR) repeat protein/O-antigen ligase